MMAIVYFSRLPALCFADQYLPVDSTGDWAYQFFEVIICSIFTKDPFSKRFVYKAKTFFFKQINYCQTFFVFVFFEVRVLRRRLPHGLPGSESVCFSALKNPKI